MSNLILLMRDTFSYSWSLVENCCRIDDNSKMIFSVSSNWLMSAYMFIIICFPSLSYSSLCTSSVFCSLLYSPSSSDLNLRMLGSLFPSCWFFLFFVIVFFFMNSCYLYLNCYFFKVICFLRFASSRSL